MQYDPYRAHFFMRLLQPLQLGILCTALAAAQNMNEPLLKETATKVSDHVYVMMGFPNVAIVVGNNATLVVDTGLGPRNGATIVRVAKKLARGPRLYLTTTHFHPEHAAGDAGFPADTILIRDTAQQKEMDENGMLMVERFSKFSPLNADLLKDVKLRTPDILFTNETTLDLGGVTARLMWLGAGHTKGDELIMCNRTARSSPAISCKAK
jgi:glyoxylase-like metal-dependent hydrolase (beta-lactamase superfamily II)